MVAEVHPQLRRQPLVRHTLGHDAGFADQTVDMARLQAGIFERRAHGIQHQGTQIALGAPRRRRFANTDDGDGDVHGKTPRGSNRRRW